MHKLSKREHSLRSQHPCRCNTADDHSEVWQRLADDKLEEARPENARYLEWRLIGIVPTPCFSDADS